MEMMKVFDIQVSPIEGHKDFGQKLWRWLEYGNDHCYWSTDLWTLEDIGEFSAEVFKDGVWTEVTTDFQPLIDHLIKHGVKPADCVLIHWWW